jgi:hypothetical protein
MISHFAEKTGEKLGETGVTRNVLTLDRFYFTIFSSLHRVECVFGLIL